MSFLSSSFANSKPSYTSSASEPLQVNSNCEEELPKKPVGQLSVNRLPTGYQHTTDS